MKVPQIDFEMILTVPSRVIEFTIDLTRCFVRGQLPKTG